ncbi:MAG: tyrosine-protein phosphatase [Anaerolineales bacterium]|nr:tyrosine-protein phosphatase [Anaerolineales bacterium]
MEERILVWENCQNVRDLGGLRAGDGRSTRWRQIIRADTPARLNEQGWAALYAYGVRTIITLRTHGMVENELDFTSPYPDIQNVQAVIEDVTDQEFLQQWAETGLWSTPLYYQDALRRWPERHAAVISAVAQAQPGGVLFHCIRGYDRTGIIALLLLALAGVELDEVVADYQLSVDAARDEYLAKQNTSVQQVIQGLLEEIDIDSYLLSGGASPQDLTAVRRRLLG